MVFYFCLMMFLFDVVVVCYFCWVVGFLLFVIFIVFECDLFLVLFWSI